ncbi:hypothetical protein PI126_g13902 [Phytophthora idaei]|nr:hypothetical protein PI126_g13902 [Phytophthora idaei]
MALKKSKFKISRVPPEVRFFFTIDTTDGVVYKCNNCSETPACAVNRGGTFDILPDDFPELAHHLAQDAAIVHDPSFESAVTKVLNGEASQLSELEREIMKASELPQQ